MYIITAFVLATHLNLAYIDKHTLKPVLFKSYQECEAYRLDKEFEYHWTLAMYQHGSRIETRCSISSYLKGA